MLSATARAQLIYACLLCRYLCRRVTPIDDLSPEAAARALRGLAKVEARMETARD